MAGCGSMQHQFEALSNSGKTPNRAITLEQINTWLADANLMDKKIKPEDTKQCFDKYKSETIDLPTFMKFLDDLGEKTNMHVQELQEKLENCEIFAPAKSTPIPKKTSCKITDAMTKIIDEGTKVEKGCRRTE